MKNTDYKDVFDIGKEALSMKNKFIVPPISQMPFLIGENVRGMSNVNPDVAVKINNKNSSSTAKSYFPGSPISKNGNTNIIADLIGPFIEKNGFNFNSESYFFDSNFNGTYGDGGDILAFKLLLFVSTDGIKVKECYEVTNPDDDEVILFLETDGGLSKQVLYGKISEKVRKQFTDKDGNLKSNLFDAQVMRGVQKYADVNQKIVEELMKKGYIEDTPIKEGFFKYLKYSAIGVTAFPKLVGWALNKIGNGIDFLKISDEFWDTENEEYFFQKDNLIEKLSISQSSITSLESLLEKKEGLDVTDLLPDAIEEMAKYVLSRLRTYIDKYNIFIKENIEKIYAGFEDPTADFIFDRISEYIAFQCGKWNALVDFVSGIFKFFGLLLEAPFKIAKDFQATLEYLDNFWDIITHDDFFKNLFESAQLTYEKIKKELKSKNSDEYSWTRIAYFSGYGLCTIATFFIPVGQLGNLTKTGKFGEITAKFTEEISRGFTKGASIITQKTAQAYQNSLKILQEIGEILINGGEKFYAFLNKIWKKIADFFIKSKDAFGRLKELMGIGLSEITSKALIKFKINVRKIGSGGLGSLGSLPDNTYKLYHKGIEIFSGKEKSVAKFTRELEAMGKEAAEKYLDELAYFKDNIANRIAEGRFTKKILKKNIDLVDESGETFFRLAKKDYEKFISFAKKTAQERKAIIEEVNSQLKNSTKKYNPDNAKLKGYDVPKSPLGTSPDFSKTPQYLYNQKSIIKIKIMGSRKLDFKESFRLMGITDGKVIKTILKDYTWHHLDDLTEDMVCTMQLVLKEAHEATYTHYGSAGQLKKTIPLKKYL
ncbi:HNH endonuclease signature motif containing protein [Chryseobacterium jejuense]|uniref:A nuclease of the HNH/ENDO VII superfamily with conserved WHH n=1 Tax=Chryseobacterium jejuense TaxID=445960 RepID=A0A2X2Z9U2_CHRJE|nr:HNH endonuclease [Chryseobacterium jejuense]SDI61516.1 A nuclease of the HNH/ENDO VII superfamily with conserved WHH [Chryseobacterium jejuense]SQB47220.1 Uncharacterised protein [Chryseobacterium jejuense]